AMGREEPLPFEAAELGSGVLDRHRRSHRWPFLTILLYVGFSAAAFTPRFINYLADGDWRRSATRAFEFAPEALNTHALFGMALIPLFFLQPVLGALIMGERPSGAAQSAHRWHGRILAVAAGALSLLGFYITYKFAANTDSVTSVIFMFLVALFVILFFMQAAWEARKHRIDRHLDALVFAMIFLSVPATGRLIEGFMRTMGVENTRSRELVSIGSGFQVELVDFTILLISAVPIVLWSLYALPRRVYRMHGAKLGIAAAFLGLPLVAVTMQTLGR
ncbi:MAG: DUF2306 domain-containing protein, partial [Pseudomonadota bacterium]